MQDRDRAETRPNTRLQQLSGPGYRIYPLEREFHWSLFSWKDRMDETRRTEDTKTGGAGQAGRSSLVSVLHPQQHGQSLSASRSLPNRIRTGKPSDNDKSPRTAECFIVHQHCYLTEDIRSTTFNLSISVLWYFHPPRLPLLLCLAQPPEGPGHVPAVVEMRRVLPGPGGMIAVVTCGRLLGCPGHVFLIALQDQNRNGRTSMRPVSPVPAGGHVTG